MRFHVLLPVRDEADIIGQCLAHLLKWADAVYVFDTGSVDESWELVQDAARHDKRVIPLKKDAVFFSETRLRGWMFNQVRSQMRDGDWFLRADADEFHHIPPPEFVRSRLRLHETIAYHQYYDFKLTESEVADWEAGRESFADRARPIEDRRRWFTLSSYSEPRLCKYRSTMRWPPTVSFPFNAGFVAKERLPIRHYPHRDPAQLHRRCRLRAIMMADQENRSNWSRPELHHWTEGEWRRLVTRDDSSGLHFWGKGSELPDGRFFGHVRQPHIRLLQRIIHSCLLPLLDRQRPKWPMDGYPQRIPDEIARELAKELEKQTSSAPYAKASGANR